MIRSRHAIIVALLFIAWGLIDTGRSPAAVIPPSPRDTDLFGAVIDRVRGGESYYSADAEAMRSYGYPTASVFNWRLPTLTLFQAALPSLGWSVAILTALGLGTLTLWFRYLSRSVGHVALLVPVLITTFPVWPLIRDSSALLHDLWAGELIALSLACWASGAVGISLAAALAAVSIRELAVPYVLVMAFMAVLERKRKEATSWFMLTLFFSGLLAWHIAHALPLLAPKSPYYGWAVLGGWRFVLKTAQVNVLLMEAPAWFVALVVPAISAGLLCWRTPVGRRVAATVTIYLAAFTIVGRPDNWYWGLIVAPLLPLGVIGWMAAGHTAARSDT
jgi:hypothetical protein